MIFTIIILDNRLRILKDFLLLPINMKTNAEYHSVFRVSSHIKLVNDGVEEKRYVLSVVHPNILEAVKKYQDDANVAKCLESFQTNADACIYEFINICKSKRVNYGCFARFHFFNREYQVMLVPHNRYKKFYKPCGFIEDFEPYFKEVVNNVAKNIQKCWDSQAKEDNNKLNILLKSREDKNQLRILYKAEDYGETSNEAKETSDKEDSYFDRQTLNQDAYYLNKYRDSATEFPVLSDAQDILEEKKSKISKKHIPATMQQEWKDILVLLEKFEMRVDAHNAEQKRCWEDDLCECK